MKRVHFILEQRPYRSKATYLYVGSHWLINSLGILLNRDRRVGFEDRITKGFNPAMPTLLPVSFEITGPDESMLTTDKSGGNEQMAVKWQTSNGNLGESVILQYYDPMPGK